MVGIARFDVLGCGGRGGNQRNHPGHRNPRPLRASIQEKAHRGRSRRRLDTGAGGCSSAAPTQLTDPLRSSGALRNRAAVDVAISSFRGVLAATQVVNTPIYSAFAAKVERA